MLEVIPSLNCPAGDDSCIGKKIAIASAFAEWLHLDVTDGVFTSPPSWSDPHAWKTFAISQKLEVHLMTEDPKGLIERWLDAGAQRIVVHLEAILRASPDDPLNYWNAMNTQCAAKGMQLMLALNPETAVEELEPYLDVCNFFQILAVHPGPAHQTMLPQMPEKVAALRRYAPGATIEVDGGIVPETARAVKDSGANIVIAGSYTLDHTDPPAAYQELKNIS